MKIVKNCGSRIVKYVVVVSMLSFIILFSMMCAGTNRQLVYRAGDQTVLQDSSLTILYIPIDTVTSVCIDNSVKRPKIDYTDSFFIDVANGLAEYELSQCFAIAQCKVTLQNNEEGRSISLTGASVIPDSTELKGDSTKVNEKPEMIVYSVPRYRLSVLKNDTVNREQLVSLVRKLAKAFSADLVAIPYSCNVKQISVRSRGWRDGKYEGSYTRPVNYTGKAEFHIQIWDKNGKLVYERAGLGNSGKPMLYNAFKKDLKTGKDLTMYARKVYAPPLVKALNEAIRNSLKF